MFQEDQNPANNPFNYIKEWQNGSLKIEVMFYYYICFWVVLIRMWAVNESFQLHSTIPRDSKRRFGIRIYPRIGSPNKGLSVSNFYRWNCNWLGWSDWSASIAFRAINSGTNKESQNNNAIRSRCLGRPNAWFWCPWALFWKNGLLVILMTFFCNFDWNVVMEFVHVFQKSPHFLSFPTIEK